MAKTTNDAIEGNFEIQNYIASSLIGYLVKKELIDLSDFQSFMGEQELKLRKNLGPEVTQAFSDQISSAFQKATLNIQDER